MQIRCVTMKQPLVNILGWLCAFVMLSACSDDDGDYVPPYLTDMVNISTDAEGTLSLVMLDNGTSFDISAQKMMSDAPETTIRCRATYTLNKGKMTLYGAAAVFADKPVPASHFTLVKNGVVYRGSEYIPRDPVKLVSMWKSGGYINLHLGVMTTGLGCHQYAFCEDGEGQYSLVHLCPWGDDASYTEQVYMSMPIPDGIDELTFSVYTYDGVYTQTFKK